MKYLFFLLFAFLGFSCQDHLTRHENAAYQNMNSEGSLASVVSVIKEESKLIQELSYSSYELHSKRDLKKCLDEIKSYLDNLNINDIENLNRLNSAISDFKSVLGLGLSPALGNDLIFESSALSELIFEIIGADENFFKNLRDIDKEEVARVRIEQLNFVIELFEASDLPKNYRNHPLLYHTEPSNSSNYSVEVNYNVFSNTPNINDSAFRKWMIFPVKDLIKRFIEAYQSISEGVYPEEILSGLSKDYGINYDKFYETLTEAFDWVKIKCLLSVLQQVQYVVNDQIRALIEGMQVDKSIKFEGKGSRYIVKPYGDRELSYTADNTPLFGFLEKWSSTSQGKIIDFDSLARMVRGINKVNFVSIPSFFDNLNRIKAYSYKQGREWPWKKNGEDHLPKDPNEVKKYYKPSDTFEKELRKDPKIDLLRHPTNPRRIGN